MTKNTKRLTTAIFIEKATARHNGLYHYEKVVYINSHTKILITDSLFGDFWQTPNAHLNGQGHPKRGRETCDNKRRVGREEFIRRAIERHGHLYDYSQVVYRNTDTKVVIIDPKFGSFEQTPHQHAVVGSGHPSRRRQTGISCDHIIPLSIVLCSKDRRSRNLMALSRPLVQFLMSDINLSSMELGENKSKADRISINGKEYRASSLRNNYDVIAHVIRDKLGVDSLELIERDKAYLRAVLGL